MIPLLASLALASPGVPLDDGLGFVRGIVVQAEAREGPAGLETRYRVEVEESLRGPAPPEVEVVLPGGRWHGLLRQVEGVPVWAPGDDAIVALGPTGAPPPLYGHFRVEGERLVPSLNGWPHTVAHLEEVLRTP